MNRFRFVHLNVHSHYSIMDGCASIKELVYPVLYDRLERVLCPHVHFKMLVFDGKEVYVGSANLSGAGIGMKGRNNSQL